MKCDFCGWRSTEESDVCPNCNRKYSDSDKLRKARKAFVISALIFGAVFAIVELDVFGDSIVPVILLVVTNVLFLFLLFRFVFVNKAFRKNLEVEAGTITTIVDKKISWKEELEQCIEQVFSVNHLRAWFYVKYRGKAVLDFYLPNLLDKEQKKVFHCITLNFYITRFENPEQIKECFERCKFYKDFEINSNFLDNEYGVKGVNATATYGIDMVKAMEVASYILANVCCIPLDTKLEYEWFYSYNPIFVSNIDIKTEPVASSVDINPENGFEYPGMEDALKCYEKTVFQSKEGMARSSYIWG